MYSQGYDKNITNNDDYFKLSLTKNIKFDSNLDSTIMPDITNKYDQYFLNIRNVILDSLDNIDTNIINTLGDSIGDSFGISVINTNWRWRNVKLFYIGWRHS